MIKRLEARLRPLIPFSRRRRGGGVDAFSATLAPHTQARLCGTTVNGRLAVLSKSGDSDLLYIASRCWKVEACDDAPSGWACVLYDRDALLEHLGLGLDGLAFFPALRATVAFFL